jgi:hypothetical protein
MGAELPVLLGEDRSVVLPRVFGAGWILLELGRADGGALRDLG